MSQSACRFPSLRERVFQGSKVAYFGTSSDYLCSRPLKYKEWTEEKMAVAVRGVLEGKSIRRAAMESGVPRSTLGDRISGRVLPGSKSGPRSYLTVEEEEELALFVTRAAAIGYGKTRRDIIALVQRICASRGLSVTVSSGWWDSFVRRHPNLTLRAPAPLSHARSIASSYDVIESYFDLLEETLEENCLMDKPGQLYNMDESGMPLDPKPPKIVHARGVKNPLSNCSNTKAQITVVACVSAAGQVLPPMVVWDRKALTPKLAEGEVPGTIYGLSPKGWMDQELLDLWFTRHFLQFIPPVRPVLLIMNGHSSHYCPDTIRLAAKEQVIVFALPPNTTHLTQPLDKGVFGPLKTRWREVCHCFLVNNPGKVITRYDFSALFSEAWFKAMRPENAIAGFKITGIYPLDRNAITIPGSVEESKTLAEKSELAFIPLYTPSKRKHASVSSYSAIEMEHFEYSYEHGLNPGSRYRDWLKSHHPEDVQCCSASSDSVASTPLSLTPPPSPTPYRAASRQPALRKFVSVPCLLEKKSHYQPPEKISARVLTSSECLQKLLEREEEKLAKQRRKDENKHIREENRKKREENKRRVIKPKKVAAKAQASADTSLFTEEEVALFTTRYDNGYDIPQDRYIQWLQTHDPNEAKRLSKQSAGALTLAKPGSYNSDVNDSVVTSCGESPSQRAAFDLTTSNKSSKVSHGGRGKKVTRAGLAQSHEPPGASSLANLGSFDSEVNDTVVTSCGESPSQRAAFDLTTSKKSSKVSHAGRGKKVTRAGLAQSHEPPATKTWITRAKARQSGQSKVDGPGTTSKSLKVVTDQVVSQSTKTTEASQSVVQKGIRSATTGISTCKTWITRARARQSEHLCLDQPKNDTATLGDAETLDGQVQGRMTHSKMSQAKDLQKRAIRVSTKTRVIQKQHGPVGHRITRSRATRSQSKADKI